jgi:pimeloyl-ACP methyl ester carboxylesterase
MMGNTSSDRGGTVVQIEIDGFKIGYDLDGSGPPVVLIHGFPLSRTMWRPQVAALRDRFTVITPDLRGFSDSDVPTGAVTMDTYAADVLRLLDALGHQRFFVGGLSMGGYVAFRIVAQAPARVRALIIADSRATPDTDEDRQRRYAAITRIRGEGPEGFLREFIVPLLGASTKAQRPQVAETLRQLTGAPPAPSLIAALAAIAERPDSRPLLPSIAAPALVVVGEEDTVIPRAESEEMVSRLPHARLATIPAAGHLPNLEMPEAFNRVVREFLEEVSYPRASIGT